MGGGVGGPTGVPLAHTPLGNVWPLRPRDESVHPMDVYNSSRVVGRKQSSREYYSRHTTSALSKGEDQQTQTPQLLPNGTWSVRTLVPLSS